jgi:hypothetical protein
MTMTWLGEEFPDDAADVSDAGVRLHIEAWCWSNRRLLDGTIRKKDLPRFAFGDDTDIAVPELIRIGWWRDDSDTWQLLHGAQWQESRDQVEARKLRNRKAQGHRRGDHRWCDQDRSCRSVSDDSTDDTSADVSVATGKGWGGQGKALIEQPLTTVAGDSFERCSVCHSDEPVDGSGLCADCSRLRSGAA